MHVVRASKVRTALARLGRTHGAYSEAFACAGLEGLVGLRVFGA